MIVEPFSAGETSFALHVQTIALVKSRFITAFGTYRGASVIIRNTFDWNLSRISKLQFDADPHNCTP